jgi:hypothetical protein
MKIFTTLTTVIHTAELNMPREDLIRIRDSVRIIAVELHNVASIMDRVISGTGGPLPNPSMDTTSRFSPHIDHKSVEELLRTIHGSESAQRELDAIQPRTTWNASVWSLLIIFISLCSWLPFICVDILLVSTLRYSLGLMRIRQNPGCQMSSNSLIITSSLILVFLTRLVYFAIPDYFHIISLLLVLTRILFMVMLSVFYSDGLFSHPVPPSRPSSPRYR